MIYSFRCQDCGMLDQLTHRVSIGQPVDHPCQHCGGLLRRVASFSYQRPMQEHFNHTVAQPISSQRQFNDALTRKNDELGERLGIDQDYQPIDLNDQQALGVTDEGLDAHRRVRRDTGLDPPTSTIIH